MQDYWEAAAEVNEVVLDADSAPTSTTASSAKPLGKQSTAAAQSAGNSRALLLAGLIALLAVVLSYLALHIFRSN